MSLAYGFSANNTGGKPLFRHAQDTEAKEAESRQAWMRSPKRRKQSVGCLWLFSCPRSFMQNPYAKHPLLLSIKRRGKNHRSRQLEPTLRFAFFAHPHTLKGPINVLEPEGILTRQTCRGTLKPWGDSPPEHAGLILSRHPARRASPP